MFKKLYIAALLTGVLASGANAQENKISVDNSNGGIKLTSADKEYQVSINGRIYMDGVHYFDDVTDLSSDVSVSDIRFGTSVRWGKWSAKVNVGFGNDEVKIKDAFFKISPQKEQYFYRG